MTVMMAVCPVCGTGFRPVHAGGGRRRMTRYCSRGCAAKPLPAPPPWWAGDAGWMESAACRSVDPELFFPPSGSPGTGARRVCAACPVIVECDARARVLRPSHGIWAGRTWADGRPK